MLPRKSLNGLLLLALVASAGCVHTIEKGVTLNADVSEDKPYRQALEQATRAKDIIDDFETKFKVRVTYFSPDFRAAFVDRLKRILLQNEPNLAEASSKTSFFVSVFATARSYTDLNNANHWTILLKTPSGELKPSAIRKVDDKQRWHPFFDYVNDWSNEYFVEFDTPTVATQSSGMVSASTLHLTMASADARVELDW